MAERVEERIVLFIILGAMFVFGACFRETRGFANLHEAASFAPDVILPIFTGTAIFVRRHGVRLRRRAHRVLLPGSASAWYSWFICCAVVTGARLQQSRE